VSGADARTLIVIAEDDADILDLVEFRLQQEGYEVLTARNGEEALRLCRKHRPALALLDVQMPRLNGYEVTERLRADEATRGMAIVILTASVRESEIARAFEAGANDFLRKPFSPGDLATRVRAALDAAAAPPH
jgi:CheY-like chemotaxis protein